MGSSTSKQEVRQKPLPPATAEHRQLRDPRRTRASQTGRKTRNQSLTPACGGLRSPPMDTTQRNLPEPRSVKKQMPCSGFLLRPEKGAIVPAALGRLIQLMQRSLLSLLVAFIAILAARDTRADSTFAGSLVSGNNEGYVAGSISLTVDRGQVFFTSTLFQTWVSGTILEPVLVVHNKVFPLPFGTGTPGSWPFQEFLWPFPGPAPCGPPVGIDPGFGRPLMFDGTRFMGSFTTHPDLEHSLLAKGGTVLLQVHGTVNSLQDPLFSAPLQHVTTPIPIPFTATLSGANERPPNRSPFRSSGTFTLTGNCLSYSVTVATNLAWASVGIFGSAGPHSTSTNLIADLRP
jgi:hypothetical protein